MFVEWSRNGYEETKGFLKSLEPENLAKDFFEYCEELGDDFSISDFMKLLEVKAITKLAAAVWDHPEYTADQLFKAFNSGQEIKASVEVCGSIMCEPN